MQRVRIRPPAVVVMGMLAFLVSCGAPPPDVSLDKALVRLQEVAPPSVRGESSMVSSYDPAGGNIDWADLKSLWIGEDRYLLASLKGPGCLRRIWMTNVRAEEWLFYVDGEREPRLRCTEKELFADGVMRFPFLPPLSDTVSGGAYTYVPIPYAKSLRIVARIPLAQPDARPYFHINYETYSPGTRVESFPGRVSSRQQEAVSNTLNRWTTIEAAMRDVAQRLRYEGTSVEPGRSAVLYQAEQGGALTTLAIRLNPPPDRSPVERARDLRHLVLRCFWDGSQTASVDVPVGDFFCNGLHKRCFASLPMANVEGTWICRFPMPYRAGARIEVRNDGPLPITIESAVESSPFPPGPVRYFHAAWNQATAGGQPFRIMRTEGKGEFMGCYLIAHGADGGWNILEGDERFFRDGAVRPVHHGTGLEDYFNGGWYYYGLFERPFHGLLEKAAMLTSQYRFQVPDPVTFEKSLMMTLEFGDANRARGYMSAASYWYLDHPAAAGSSLPEAALRFPPFDQVAAAASMAGIFELERAGLEREAEARSAYFGELFGTNVMGQLFALRAIAYREIREGAEAVREAYANVISNGVPEAAEQARLLLWRGEKPFRAIYGGCAYSTFRLYVDDRKIGEGGHPFIFQGFPVELKPGSHMLRAEIKSSGDHSWYALAFSSAFTSIVSDVSWDYAVTRPRDWPAGDGDAALWKPYAIIQGFFPMMQWWQFVPNAYPGVQSGQQVGGPFAGWEKPAGRVIYLRRKIEVPTDPSVRIAPIDRRKEIRSPAVRPAGDISNQGLSH